MKTFAIKRLLIFAFLLGSLSQMMNLAHAMEPQGLEKKEQEVLIPLERTIEKKEPQSIKEVVAIEGLTGKRYIDIQEIDELQSLNLFKEIIDYFEKIDSAYQKSKEQGDTLLKEYGSSIASAIFKLLPNLNYFDNQGNKWTIVDKKITSLNDSSDRTKPFFIGEVKFHIEQDIPFYRFSKKQYLFNAKRIINYLGKEERDFNFKAVASYSFRNALAAGVAAALAGGALYYSSYPSGESVKEYARNVLGIERVPLHSLRSPRGFAK